jgi:hypothetical protein
LVVLLALVAALAAAGCGRSTGTVTGTVTYKGAKLKGGTVMFTRADGEGTPIAVLIMEDGTYSAPQVPAGETKVTVETEYLKPRGPHGGVPTYEKPKGDIPAGGADYTPPSANTGKNYTAVPQKYWTTEATPLTLTVTGGSQKYDITLED